MGIEVIYKMLINGIELNDKNIEGYGLKNDDIRRMINDNVIRFSNNKYEIVYVQNFFKYGLKLFKEGNISSANACFYKCYELCPSNKKICLQVLTLELKRQNKRDDKNYEKAFAIFLNFEKITEKRNLSDNNLYLFLLSYIYNDIPKEYKELIVRIRENNFNDLMLKKKASSIDENRIREAIIKKKFKYAFTLIEGLINKQNVYSVKFEALRALLNVVIECEEQFNSKLLNLIENENYEEIFNILEARANLMGLNKIENNILLVVKSIIDIKNTNIIPKVCKGNLDSLDDAIFNNNFELAYSLVLTYLEKYKVNKNNNILYLVLVKINRLIYELKNIKISEIEDIAYFIRDSNVSLEEASGKYSLTLESLLLIKLIYVRDYYIECKYLEGDTLLKEVEAFKGNFIEIDKYIDELIVNRNNYKERLDIYTRSRNRCE